VAANKLDRQFTRDQPDRGWVSDITYVPTAEGWLFLAVVIDIYSRLVVGHAMADHLKAGLALDALEMALRGRSPAEGAWPDQGLLHHSDRGVQYACASYRAVLEAHGIEPLMSRTGNCYDNAVAESFFATFKRELVDRERYATRDAARQSIFEYIEVFYNRQRRHSTLGYMSPAQFEKQRAVA
jgi:putative transposase